jgi:hypothetical protein
MAVLFVILLPVPQQKAFGLQPRWIGYPNGHYHGAAPQYP